MVCRVNSSVTEATNTSVVALTVLSEAERQVALERFRLLQPNMEQGVALTTLTHQVGIP